MRQSIRTKLFWGHLILFLAASAVSILITWMEFEFDGGAGEAPSAHWRLVLIAAAFACSPVLLLAVASGWYTRRALAPIVTLTQAAERIREDNLHEEIPVIGDGDEIARLGLVLNDMRRRLDGSFQKIREFTLHASHELKTPLTILMAGFEKALLDPELTDAHRDRLVNWLDELERLNRIVSGLTLLTQGDAHQVELNLEKLDLAELVADSASEAEILGQSLDLTVTVHAPATCLIGADRHCLRQLLLNVTDNAVKYNREGGYVEFRVYTEGEQACVDIRSGGRGIDAEELPQIFNRFFRSSTSRGTVSSGCGLGLSIAKWIAEEHGGTLTAKSAPDNTVLSLRLPINEERDPAKTKVRSPAPMPLV
jgi:signal transduction histidine kinase